MPTNMSATNSEMRRSRRRVDPTAARRWLFALIWALPGAGFLGATPPALADPGPMAWFFVDPPALPPSANSGSTNSGSADSASANSATPELSSRSGSSDATATEAPGPTGAKAKGKEAVPPEEEEENFQPCADPRPRRDWFDRFGYGVYRTVCGSAQWLDRFFGGERGYRETDSSYGRLGVGTAWDENEGLRVRGRFKARINLPRLENRMNAFLGRFEEDEFIQGQSDDVGAVPALFRETQEKDWLIGLGYNPARSARGRLDVDAGIRVDFPVDPFVKITYRYYLFVSDTRLLRFGQTAFWTNHLGAGTTTRLDLEKALGDKFHARWQTLGTMAEKTEGLDWRSSLTIYHHLGGQRAIAWLVEVNGETDAPIHLDEYGLRSVYRTRFLRDDLFLELQGRVFWPKTEVGGDRKATAGLGFGFEMLWGRNDLQAARAKLKKRNKSP